MTAYYNEIDPYAAAWLRNLISAGHIAPGDVDERDIRDIRPDDLVGYTQCHFFAGIGVWSHALRSAGWPDDRPVWTGSCPCQPFSAAGKRGGTDDERHLWPAFFHLIGERRPPVVFGEQVASKDGLGWLDLVQADLEGADYAIGAFDLCAAGVGAPHIRQRLWFVADAAHEQLGGAGELGHPDSQRPQGQRPDGHQVGRQGPDLGSAGLRDGAGGFWSDAEWIPRRDGKWRPVEPVALTVVDGLAPGLGSVRPGHLAEIELEVAEWSVGHEADAGEALHDLRCALSEEAVRERAGGLPGVHEAPFLLAFLRQLEKQGWAFAECVPGESAEIAEERMRVLRHAGAAARPSCERGLDGQPAGERADALRLLSSILARHAQEAWGDAYRAYAPIGFPLEHGAFSRVGRLRAYGNAIVAPLAAEFIGAYLDARNVG